MENLNEIEALLAATPEHYPKPDGGKVLSVEPTVAVKRSQLAALLTELRQLQEAARWRDIKVTQPKEREKVLALCEDWGGIHVAHWYFNYHVARCLWNVETINWGEPVVTHWMPLPQLPQKDTP